MTTRPRLATGVNYVNGIAAVALFAVLAWVFVDAGFPAPAGFGEGSITATLGYAMFDLLELIPEGHGETEGFLVAFLVVAIALDAALDGSLMLARREEAGDTATIPDGGRIVGAIPGLGAGGDASTRTDDATDGGED